VQETGAIPTGLFDSPWRRAEGVFLQPRRFPEYLRLQNVRDRGVDLAELSPTVRRAGDGGGEPPVAPAGSGRDATLARIGEVRPVEPRGCGASAAAGSGHPDPPPTTRSIDGLGRMIDLMA
jgi:hypothetical protein